MGIIYKKSLRLGDYYGGRTMSNLREPGLGPIIGHTTSTSCRIWIRAATPGDEGANLAATNRTLGVISITHKNDKKIQSPKVYYFRLKREYDRTGTFTFGVDVGLGDKESDVSPALEPDTHYTVKVGTLTLDDPFPEEATLSNEHLSDFLPRSIAWRGELNRLEGPTSKASFKTFPTENVTGDINFILGSCRYPGLLWKTKKADKIFGPVKNVALDGYNPFTGENNNEADRCRFTLMVGDQIYADKLHKNVPVGRADTFEEFQERYLTAFGSSNMQQLLSSIPTYMILDDHEIEDNWTQDRVKQSSKRTLFNLALHSYMSYQWNHCPKNFGKRLYYNFECSGYPFFVLDTRTQRFIDVIEEEDHDNHLLGSPSLSLEDEPSQLDRLLAWLVTQQKDVVGNAPKFIVTSSVFTPNPMSARIGKSVKHREDSDSWPGFPNTREAILRCITDNEIQNVIFLSGDIHCANVAKMTFGVDERIERSDLTEEQKNRVSKAEKIKAFSITSSAFYWPFPFADGDPSNYVHDSRDIRQKDTFNFASGLSMDYTAEGFTQDDNFCHVSVNRDKHQIKVTAFNKEGSIIKKTGGDGVERQLISTLELAEW